MELNTNERRINTGVKQLLEQGKMEYAVKEVSKLYRYQLIKIADAKKYLTPSEFITMFGELDPFFTKIEQGRINEGKTPGNDYIVINRDEPYINEIIAILAKNGHWDGENNDHATAEEWFEKWTEERSNEIFEVEKFKKIGKGNDHAFQALVFLGEASEKLSIAHTIIKRDAKLMEDESIIEQLRKMQNWLHDFKDYIRTGL